VKLLVSWPSWPPWPHKTRISRVNTFYYYNYYYWQGGKEARIKNRKIKTDKIKKNFRKILAMLASLPLLKINSN